MKTLKVIMFLIITGVFISAMTYMAITSVAWYLFVPTILTYAVVIALSENAVDEMVYQSNLLKIELERVKKINQVLSKEL